MTDPTTESPTGPVRIPATTVYAQEIESADRRLDQTRRRDRILTAARVVTFFAAVFLAFIGWGDGRTLTLAALTFATFLACVTVSETLRETNRRCERRREWFRRALARPRRDWDELDRQRTGDDGTTPGVDVIGTRGLELAGDLDLFGRASLERFVSLAVTEAGHRELARQFTTPIDADTANDRGRWVRTLTDRRGQRLDWNRQASQTDWEPIDRFRGAASGRDRIPPPLTAWAAVASVLSVGSLAAVAIGWGAGSEPAWRYGLTTLATITAINLLITLIYLARVHADLAEGIPPRERLRAITTITTGGIDLCRDGGPQADSVREPLERFRQSLSGLSRTSRAASLKASPLTYPLFLFLQLTGLYDVWVARGWYGWRERHTDGVAEWWAAIGRLEAATSAAAVAEEHPDWASIRWVPPGRGSAIEAVNLGHPLIPDADRVGNDVTVGPPGRFLLITGSNMSGKSTLMRSLGLAIALGRTGSPVCAASMTCPAARLATSIRVTDDVDEGTSFYMAELHRLRTVVDIAESDNRETLPVFLLDEILRGTNSRERQIAVASVIRRLIEAGAVGAVSTHDLELAGDTEIAAIAESVHFRETIDPTIDGPAAMTFDYRMRPGPCPTTNALRLLALVGLGPKSAGD